MIKNTKDLKIVPCGTPLATVVLDDVQSLTKKVRPFK